MSARVKLRRTVATGVAALFAAFAIFMISAPAASAEPSSNQVTPEEVEWT
ncbi:hypothetical protein FB566_2606 [Stackebrandtia endophytica]|uniref:Uncharacterized protein n=1 Tax=Stackebrandtia endophytica TaxID=1496996 RepID=A0A543AWW5_9ACTN|nr:hypothetical protein [Stackebrandtia endophytica]TQL77062.1 hypothetical protein FB566_2606 [Stackebrandtia endophytica]